MNTDYKALVQDSRLLIVDDKCSNIVVLQRILQQEGYQNVCSTTDSREVIDQLRVFRPDLILLDLMMPKVDGYAVIVQLRGWIPDDEFLPIIVITADVSRGARQKALSLGANDFITKPVDATDVVLRVQNLLHTQRLYRQLRDRNHRLKEQVATAQQHLQQAHTQILQLEQEPSTAIERLAAARTSLEEAVEGIAGLIESPEPDPAEETKPSEEGAVTAP